jgi:hypothetical protein
VLIKHNSEEMISYDCFDKLYEPELMSYENQYNKLTMPVILLCIEQRKIKGLFQMETFFKIMQFSQKSELTPALFLPKSAILALILPKYKRLRPLPNKARKITEC